MKPEVESEKPEAESERRVEALEAKVKGLEALLAQRTQAVLDQTHRLAVREHDLKQSVAELSRFFDLSLDLMGVAGMDGYFKQVNPAFTTTLGWSAADMLTKPFIELIHPDDVASTLAEVEKLGTGRPTIAFENRYRCRDGAWKWLQWHAMPVPDEGVMFAVGRDVSDAKGIATALKDREARLSAVLESALDGLVLIDHHGSIETINPAAERIFGWTSGDLRGQNVKVLMPEPYHSNHDEYLSNYLQTGERKIIGIGREVVGLRRDGTTFPLDLAVTEVRAGSIQLFLGSVRDITQRKSDEAAKAAQLAKDAHQQGRLETSAGILHDLGNVLSGIGARAVEARALVQQGLSVRDNLNRTVHFLRGSLEPLIASLGEAKAKALVQMLDGIAREEAKLRDDAAASLDKMLGFLSHAQELLTTHRNYSGAGSGARRERMDLRKLLFDAQLLMSDGARKRGGRVHLVVEDQLPGVVVERSKLMQVLLNLLKNAVESYDTDLAAARLPEINIAARRADHGIVVEVRDYGGGFDPAVADKLLAGGYTTKTHGSGTGLVSSRRLTESFGGQLELHSEGPGQGAVARIFLPSSMLSS